MEVITDNEVGGENWEITSRDVAVLEFISKTGVATTQQVQQIFQSAWYHYKRLKILERRGYIIRRGRHLHITKKGSKLIGCTQPWVRTKDHIEQGTKLSELMLELSDSFEFISSRMAKTMYGLNRSAIFDGLLASDSKQYTVYLLSSEPRKRTVQSIKHEISKHAVATNLQRAIVFAPSLKAMQAFGSDDCGTYELLLLPYPSGARLLHDFTRSEVHDYIKNLLPGTEPVSSPFADYMAGDTYVSVLVLNDLVRRARLTDYFNWDLEKKPVLIVCLRSQLPLFKELYPKAEFSILPEDLLPRYKNRHTS